MPGYPDETTPLLKNSSLLGGGLFSRRTLMWATTVKAVMASLSVDDTEIQFAYLLSIIQMESSGNPYARRAAAKTERDPQGIGPLGDGFAEFCGLLQIGRSNAADFDHIYDRSNPRPTGPLIFLPDQERDGADAERKAGERSIEHIIAVARRYYTSHEYVPVLMWASHNQGPVWTKRNYLPAYKANGGDWEAALESLPQYKINKKGQKVATPAKKLLDPTRSTPKLVRLMAALQGLPVPEPRYSYAPSGKRVVPTGSTRGAVASVAPREKRTSYIDSEGNTVLRGYRQNSASLFRAWYSDPVREHAAGIGVFEPEVADSDG